MLAAELIPFDDVVDETTATNVGPALTSFVGREGDLETLRVLLGPAQLLTVTGPAGVGKTRLALELVRRDPPLDERWFCDLSEARSVDGICAAVARAIGAALAQGKSPDENVALVARALRARGPAIVILDNFEQVRSHAGIIERWAAAAPETRFVVTSRVPLGLRTERVVPLGPLASVEEAAALFVERARALRHGFAPSASERAAIAEIVARLDMMPLAIELAASRIRVLGARQIADHLERRFALLRGEGGGRQATLRDAIDWSWQLLSPHERRALAQCSVFCGGFDLAAAEEVLALGDDAPWVLDTLQALVEHSLVQGYEAREGELRYRLYESVRAFAAEKLDDPDVGARHTAHFTRRAAALRSAVEGRAARRALIDLGLETENLLAVHRRAVEAGDGAAALGCALALTPLFSARGPLTALADPIDRAIAIAGDDPRLPEALLVRAEITAALARPDASLPDRERALTLAEARGDRRLAGRARASLARHAWQRGRLERAAELYEEALGEHREAGDHAFEGKTLACLADILYLQGQARAARDTYDLALLILRRHGDPSAEALALGNLGCLEHDCGHEQRARLRLEEARSILVDLESRHDESHVVTQLGIVALAQRDVTEARAHFDRAIDLGREVGNRRHEGVVLAYLGQCEELDGDRDASRRGYDRAIGLLHDHGHTLLEGLARAWRGRLEADVDEIDLASRFLDESRTLLASVGKTIVSAVPLLCAAHLDLALGRAAEGRGDHEGARRYRDTARAVAKSVRADGAASSSGDVREALARLDEALREADTLPSVAPPSLRGMEPVTPQEAALAISAGGRTFCAPGGEPVDLSTRAAPRRILKALADHRDREPGQALTVEALLEAGWPGERLLPDAGKTRVYTAVATLRRMGLKPYLLRVDEGYLLDPALPLCRD